MNNTQPENNQPPSWFAEASAPVVVPPNPANPTNKRKLLTVLIIVASLVLVGGGMALYFISTQNARVSAAESFREKYLDFYTSMSSINDRMEPEGVDPVEIATHWRAYKDATISLKQSSLFSSQQSIIGDLESAGSPFDTYVTSTIPVLAEYMTSCFYNSEAGAAEISDSCFTQLQGISNSSDSLTQATAKRLLEILSAAQSKNSMNDAEIASAQELEAKLFAVPDDFVATTYPHIIQLGKSIGVNFETE